MPRSLSHGARLHCVKCYTNTDVKCQISGNTNDKSKKTTHFSLRHYCNYFKRLASVMIRAIPNSQLWKTCHGPRNQTSPVKSSYWRQGAGGRTAGSSQARGSCQASGSSIKQEQDMLFPCTAAWGRQGAEKWDPPLGTYPSCRKLQDWAAVESWWRWGWSPLCCWEHSSQGLLAASSGQVGEARLALPLQGHTQGQGWGKSDPPPGTYPVMLGALIFPVLLGAPCSQGWYPPQFPATSCGYRKLRGCCPVLELPAAAGDT